MIINVVLVVTLAYYTALLNTVERSIHLHGPSRIPVVNYFSIMTVNGRRSIHYPLHNMVRAC